MDDAQSGDPFLWDVDTVVAQLCAAGKPWIKNLIALRDAIVDNGINGEILLTYEFIFSSQWLMEEIGLKAAGAKFALRKEIISLQRKSKEFRRWKQNHDAEQVKSEEYEESQGKTEHKDPKSETHDEQPSINGHSLPEGDPQHPRPGDHGESSTEQSTLPFRSQTSENPMESNPQSASHHNTIEKSEIPSHDRPELEAAVPAKRRRIAPVHLVNQPANPTPNFIPTEADSLLNQYRPMFMHMEYGGDHRFWDGPSPTAYYGYKGLPDTVICQPEGTLSSSLVSYNENDFAVIIGKKRPPGQCFFVHKTLKKLFRSNSQLRGSYAETSALSEVSDDLVLEMDDLPEEFDAQTLAEIQQEIDEKEKAGKEKAKQLTAKQVQALLDQSILEMEEHWKEVKLPRLCRKAHQLWTDLWKRGGFRNTQIKNNRLQADRLEQRIQKLRREIEAGPWMKEVEVKNQAKCIEQSVEDKLTSLWHVDLYTSREEPPKPENLPRLKPRVKPLPPSDGEDILTSSDEEDFVVPDDDKDVVMSDGDPNIPEDEANEENDDTRVIKAEAEAEEESCDFMDLTGIIGTPRKSTRGPEVIDLITPTKPRTPARTFAAEPPSSAPQPAADEIEVTGPEPIETYSDVDKVVGKTWRHWMTLGDRYRITIWLLRKMLHRRTEPVFAIIRNKEASSVFESTVRAHLQDPLQDMEALDGISTDKTIAFDVTRVFLSFLKCKVMKPTRVVKVNANDRKLLQKDSSEDTPPMEFVVFCDFVNKVAGFFPDASQVFNVDAFDGDFPEDFLDDEEAQLDADPHKRGKGQKGKKKEIIQNKAAVDFRLQEQQRLANQEARRKQLHETLERSGEITQDKSRLIINDTKEEHHEVVYVHDHIANAIKDHQIEGVRFMWNQVLARQGCLLAHTMGLGKTMQVITLLVAIATTAKSTNESAMLEQIPKELRTSMTLVLCPPGLIDNWMDEFLLWAPKGSIWPVRKLDSSLSTSVRSNTVEAWVREGGVLIVGYSLFKILIQDEIMEERLLQKPNIVIADEAHNMKNPQAQITQICANFKTRCRIALTGSPLANNVEEYHAMIDWVAPNFLGPLGEFQEIYSRPIHYGLYSESTPYEKRRALKLLHVLKETVAPKMSRATMECLRSDLPDKFEYVLSFAPTDEQKFIYNTYVTAFMSQESEGRQTRVFGLVNHLGLMCNHPRIFTRFAKDAQKKVANGEVSDFPPTMMEQARKLSETPESPHASQKVSYLLLILDEAKKAGEKVLVFTHSIETLNYLEQLLIAQRRHVRRLDGSTKTAARQDAIKEFQHDVTEVFLISIKAGGVGLNIQAASRVVIFDSRWNPVDEQQAIGRAWRIGQVRTVFVYRFLIAGTFEDDLQNKSVFKMQLAARVVDKTNPVLWAKKVATMVHEIRPVEPKDVAKAKGTDLILDKLIEHSAGREITSIIQTDVFKEEDPSAELSAEEKKEAKDMAEMNRLRTANPGEYSRRLAAAEREEQLAHIAVLAATKHRNSHGILPVKHPVAGLAQNTGVHPHLPTTPQPASLRTVQESTSSKPQQSPVTLNGSPGVAPSNTAPLPQAKSLTPIAGEPSQSHHDEPQRQLATESTSDNNPQNPPISPNTDGSIDSPVFIDSHSEMPTVEQNPWARIAATPGAQGNFLRHRLLPSSAPPHAMLNTPPAGLPTASLTLGPSNSPRPFAPNGGPSNGSFPMSLAGSTTFIGAGTPGATQGPRNDINNGQSRPPVFSAIESQAKRDFRAKLTAEISRVSRDGCVRHDAGSPGTIANKIVGYIHEHREMKGEGFLPDNMRWKLLLEKLDEPRFVVSVTTGFWNARHLALDSKENIERSVEEMKSCSEQEFQHRIGQFFLSHTHDLHYSSNQVRSEEVGRQSQ